MGTRFNVLGQQRIVGLRGIVVGVSGGYRFPDENTLAQRRDQECQSQPFQTGAHGTVNEAPLAFLTSKKIGGISPLYPQY